MATPKKVYRRTYRGLIRKAKADAKAIKYPNFKVGDNVRVVNDILKIDERITGSNDGYVGEQTRRRMRYKYLHRNSIRGTIVKICIADIYVQFKRGDSYYDHKHGLDKPILFRKQMLELV